MKTRNDMSIYKLMAEVGRELDIYELEKAEAEEREVQEIIALLLPETAQ